MSRFLGPQDGSFRVLGPTTPATFVRRMLLAADVVARHLPHHFTGGDPLYILLTLMVAHEEGSGLTVADLRPSAAAGPRLAGRWVNALAEEGWLDRQGDGVVLTSYGHAGLTRMIEDLYAAQRRLD